MIFGRIFEGLNDDQYFCCLRHVKKIVTINVGYEQLPLAYVGGTIWIDLISLDLKIFFVRCLQWFYSQQNH